MPPQAAYPREDRPPPRIETPRFEPPRAAEPARPLEPPRVVESPRLEEATPAERPPMPPVIKKEAAVAEPAVKHPENKPPKPEQH
jgi:hypothetical protein